MSGGGEGSAGVIKNQTVFFLRRRKKVCFQKPFRTSLGPPKHVFHLVWSDSDISTAINIALKLARLGQFMAIIEAIIKAENKKNLDGTKCKICFTQ